MAEGAPIPAPLVSVTDAAPEWLLLRFLRDCDCRATEVNEARVERLCMRAEALGLIGVDGKIKEG